MRYKEISLNGKSDVTARDIVAALMKELELLYDWIAPEIDIEFALYNRYGYETLEIGLIFDSHVRTFYVNTENLRDADLVSEVAKNVEELFYTELKELDELYKK